MNLNPYTWQTWDYLATVRSSSSSFPLLSLIPPGKWGFITITGNEILPFLWDRANTEGEERWRRGGDPLLLTRCIYLQGSGYGRGFSLLLLLFLLFLIWSWPEGNKWAEERGRRGSDVPRKWERKEGGRGKKGNFSMCLQCHQTMTAVFCLIWPHLNHVPTSVTRSRLWQ